jgi:hypothetical protein
VQSGLSGIERGGSVWRGEHKLWFRALNTAADISEWWDDRAPLGTADIVFVTEGSTVIADAHLSRAP